MLLSSSCLTWVESSQSSGSKPGVPAKHCRIMLNDLRKLACMMYVWCKWCKHNARWYATSTAGLYTADLAGPFAPEMCLNVRPRLPVNTGDDWLAAQAGGKKGSWKSWQCFQEFHGSSWFSVTLETLPLFQATSPMQVPTAPELSGSFSAKLRQPSPRNYC